MATNKKSVLLSAGIAEAITSLAGTTLDTNEQDQLYSDVFEFFLRLMSRYDSETVETMSQNFDNLVW